TRGPKQRESHVGTKQRLRLFLIAADESVPLRLFVAAKQVIARGCKRLFEFSGIIFNLGAKLCESPLEQLERLPAHPDQLHSGIVLKLRGALLAFAIQIPPC